MSAKLTFYACLFCCAFLLPGCRTASDQVRINQLQVIGSHNSYHLRAHDSLMAVMAARNPSAPQALDYNHPPLPEQFERLGIRQIELDCFVDRSGGLYAQPKGPLLAAAARLPPVPDYDPEGKLRRPGFKVMHVPDVDYHSSVLTLADGLRQVRDWSERHPRHVPIFILLELKEGADSPELTRAPDFTSQDLDSLEKEILSVFDRKEILTPDDVRGHAASLPEALHAHGWPALNSARGKVFFGMDNESAVRDIYLTGHPALEGRLLFVSVPPSNPAAAWMKRNDPIAQFDEIQTLVKSGFLVRTRADADTRQARTNDPRQRDKAMASGAQFISTDYREPNLKFSTYSVNFGNDIVARANPVNGDPSLQGIDLEKSTRRRK